MVLDDYVYDRKYRTIINNGHCREFPEKVRFSGDFRDVLHFQLPLDYRPLKLFIDVIYESMYLLLEDKTTNSLPEDNEEDFFLMYGCKNMENKELELMKVNSFEYRMCQKKGLETLGMLYLSRISFTDEEGKPAKIICEEKRIWNNFYYLKNRDGKMRLISLIDSYVYGVNTA